MFCGGHFMAEKASMDKTVLIPDLDAGCSLAESITPAELRNWRTSRSCSAPTCGWAPTWSGHRQADYGSPECCTCLVRRQTRGARFRSLPAVDLRLCSVDPRDPRRSVIPMRGHLHSVDANVSADASHARPIRVVLADDHPALRRSLRLALDREGNLRVVGEAGDPETA